MEIDFASPIGPQLKAILHRQIVHNELLPGSLLSEAEVGRTFGVSRQPVREVFIRLAEEGLVEVRPQRGTVVLKIDSAAVLNARFVREAVEADIVQMLARKPDVELVEELREQLEKQERVARKCPSDFIIVDECFHRTLATSAGMAGAWQIIQTLKSQMDRVRFLAAELHSPARLIEQHRRVVDCIELGDVATAEIEIRKHLRGVLDDLPEIMRRKPDAFKPRSADHVFLSLLKLKELS